MVANTVDSHFNYCIICKQDKHPIYLFTIQIDESQSEYQLSNQIIFV